MLLAALEATTSYKVLYMSFDRFLLAVESCDLSQADKSTYDMSVSFGTIQVLCHKRGGWLGSDNDNF